MSRTRAQAKVVIHTWQQRLGLEGWNIEVEFGGNEDNANASIWISTDYRRAVVHLYDGWADASRHEFNRVALHELVHLHLNEMRTAQRSIFGKRLLPAAAEEVYDDRFVHELERATEDLTVVLIRGFGLV